MTTVVISQPMLFPWPGFFEQLMLADVYIFLDDVQFSKGSFTNRVQLRFGVESKWMSIPLAQKGAFHRIDELMEADHEWRSAHREMVRQSLRGAPYLDHALTLVDQCYRHDGIRELLTASIELPAGYLEIAKSQKRLRACSLGVPGSSWQRVLGLVKAVGGTRYVTGHGAAHYLDHEAFEAAGVEVDYMQYSLTEWPRGGARFVPYVSILDLIAFAGARAREYLRPKTVSWRTFLNRDGADA